MLERTRWVTTVYVDDKEMGTNRSLVAPHDCDLGILTPGGRLSIRIDNRMQQPAYRFDGHSVSDAEGSTWNGIVGRIELAATSPVWIDDAQVFPNVEGTSRRRSRCASAMRRATPARDAVSRFRNNHRAGNVGLDERWAMRRSMWLPGATAVERVHAGAAAPDAEAEWAFGGRPPRPDVWPARDQVRWASTSC
jgi:hypothetical protein